MYVKEQIEIEIPERNNDEERSESTQEQELLTRRHNSLDSFYSTLSNPA
jgi:hypothetical protein